jgi:acyl transferase domain-containing protein
VIVASLVSGVPVEDACVRGLASLYVAGASIDWSCVHGTARRFVRLPAYRWRRERCWFEEPLREPDRHADPAHDAPLEVFS